ncbi:hypothetical protein NW759_009567 [Fusarium solani]|nr:hypothetical protein NW759_009567 [Fusarium solani]
MTIAIAASRPMQSDQQPHSILVTLEWMLFGSILAFKAHIGKVALIDISAQFACLCFSLFVYSIGLVAFTSIPMV